MSVAYLCDIDIAPILDFLPNLDEAWTEETWRQSLHFTPHRDSETIFLRRQPGTRPRDVLHQLAVVATRNFCHTPIAETVDQACAAVDGRIARAMLVRLRPGGVIEPHVDIGAYADATERLHLPLVTNPGAWLEVDGERYHLEAGKLFSFDKHVAHCGANEGEEPRLHAIIDYFPEAGGVLA